MTSLNVKKSSYTPDDLTIKNTSSRDVLLKEGFDYKRGTLLGEVDRDTVVVTAEPANAGNGAFGAVTLGSDAEVGDYKITCVETSTNAGTFEIETPSGLEIRADVTVGTAYSSSHLNFTISDGSNDFSVNDSFTATVSASTVGEYLQSVATAVDGSQKPSVILGEDVDATNATSAVKSWAYDEGHFNENKMLFGAGHSASSVKDHLRKLNITLRGSNQANF